MYSQRELIMDHKNELRYDCGRRVILIFSFTTDNTLLYRYIFETTTYITMHVVPNTSLLATDSSW